MARMSRMPSSITFPSSRDVHEEDPTRLSGPAALEPDGATKHSGCGRWEHPERARSKANAQRTQALEATG